MARVKDLWHVEVPDPDDPTKKIKTKTKRHPDNGGSKDAKRWLAIWIGPGGREKTKAFKIQDAAKRHGRDMEVSLERGEYIDPEAGKQLLGPLGRKWLRLRQIGAGSDLRYESVLRRHIEPTFAHRQAKSPKPSEILEWLLGLAETHGTSTREAAYTILCGTFDLAVADSLRKDNPVRSPIVPKPRRDAAERESWRAEQVWSVIDAHPAQYRAIPISAAGLGLRQGEDLALAEEDFDFDEGKVHIRRQVLKIGKLRVFKLPKGGKERVVPMSAGLARVIKSHIDAYPPRPYSLPWMGEDGNLADEEHTCKIIFRWHGDDPRSHDKHVVSSSYNLGIWKPALAAAGIIPPAAKNSKGKKRYAEAREHGMHMLRHFYTTALLDAGVSLAGVMEFVGHSKKGKPITLGVYGHITEDTFETARTAIDRALFRLRAVQDPIAGGTETEQAVTG